MILNALKNIFNTRSHTDGELMRRYQQAVNDAIVYRVRAVLAIGSLVFLSVTILDRIMYPAYVSAFLTVRIITVLIFSLLFALTFTKPVQNQIIYLSDLSILTVGGAINYLVFISVGIESTYYEGMNHVFLGMLIMNTFSIRHAVATGFLIILGYILAVLGNPTMVPHFWQILGNKIILMNLTLLLIGLMIHIYKTQHYREFLKTEELRQTAEKLNATNLKLVQTEKVKDEFFANVSHELRTPLTLTLAPVESLLAGESGNLSAPQIKLLRTIHNNATRLLQMVSGLLDFSRIEARQLSVAREPMDIIAVTRATLDDFAPLFRQKELNMEFQSEDTQAEVLMDRYLYDRILFNLLSNAIKFTPPGGKIHVEIKLANDRLILTVADTGIGIAAKDIPLLFQKFQQLESSSTRRFDGTGLGLALVKEFSSALGGEVSVQSAPGKGSTFTVNCAAPFAPASEKSSGISNRHSKLIVRYSETEAPLTPSCPPAKKALPRVLIAEDNLELGSYIKSLLMDICQSQIVTDGEEALDVARTWHPDLILADVMMPKKDGITLCKDIKSNPLTLKIPFVLLTALTHREALLRGWESGADEYLFKPFHPKELIARVKSILNALLIRRETDRTILEKNATVAHARSELEQLQLFAFAATHDLQEPLKNILLQTDVLETQSTELHLNNEVLQRLGRLRASALRMSQMIEQLRVFANVKAAASPFQRVDLNKVLRDTLTDLEPRITAVNAKVHVDTLPAINGDESQLRQLFQNLIGNAIKFASKDNTPCIFVRVKQNDPLYAEIKVEDNGIGFDPKYANIIFKPFQRLHTHSQYEGTGMGLAICQKIVLRHRGDISVKSELDKGTIFTIKLPYHTEDLLSIPGESHRS